MESKNRKNNLMKASGKFYPASAGEKLEAMSVELFEEEYGINFKYMVNIKSAIKKNLREIVDNGMDFYYNFMDEHPEYNF